MAELPNKTYAIQDSARQWSQNLSEFQPQPQIDLHCSSEVVQLTWFHCILVFFSEGNMADEIKGVLKDRIDCSADLAEAQLAAAKDVVGRQFEGLNKETQAVVVAAVLSAIALNFQTRSQR